MPMSLVNHGTRAEHIDLRDGSLTLWTNAVADCRSNRLTELCERVDWQQHLVKVFGRTHPAPRLSAWYGDPGARYHYSGIRLEPEPWSTLLMGFRDAIQQVTGCAFNAVLLNRYRDGRDGMGWHSDDETELGDAPIAILSLGAARRLLFRRRDRRSETHELSLDSGSILLMHPPVQRFWHHSVPKTRRQIGERISLTFRLVITDPLY